MRKTGSLASGSQGAVPVRCTAGRPFLCAPGALSSPLPAGWVQELSLPAVWLERARETTALPHTARTRHNTGSAESCKQLYTLLRNVLAALIPRTAVLRLNCRVWIPALLPVHIPAPLPTSAGRGWDHRTPIHPHTHTERGCPSLPPG